MDDVTIQSDGKYITPEDIRYALSAFGFPRAIEEIPLGGEEYILHSTYDSYYVLFYIAPGDEDVAHMAVTFRKTSIYGHKVEIFTISKARARSYWKHLVKRGFFHESLDS
jgi:hypothetical protein